MIPEPAVVRFLETESRKVVARGRKERAIGH
jgi:hypothetical protein